MTGTKGCGTRGRRFRPVPLILGPLQVHVPHPLSSFPSPFLCPSGRNEVKVYTFPWNLHVWGPGRNTLLPSAHAGDSQPALQCLRGGAERPAWGLRTPTLPPNTGQVFWPYSPRPALPGKPVPSRSLAGSHHPMKWPFFTIPPKKLLASSFYFWMTTDLKPTKGRFGFWKQTFR